MNIFVHWARKGRSQCGVVRGRRGTMTQIPVHLTAACWNKYHKLWTETVRLKTIRLPWLLLCNNIAELFKEVSAND